MRIRKRSTAALSSSRWEKAGTSTFTGEEAEAAKEKEFLLPLVAAVMDVQAKEEAQAQFGEEDATVTAAHGIREIHTRPVHNSRNASLQCKAESEAIQVGGEADRSKYRWNGIVRRNPRDTFRLVTNEGCVKEGTPSILKQDMTWLDRQWKLPKSGRPEKCLMWRQRGQGTATKKRSKLDCTTKCHIKRNINADREDAFKTNKKETIRRNKPKMKGKVDDNDKDNYMHPGSQCRRTNGSGWRCSERTLVRYFLCEHHLSKGRLKSINTSNGAAPVVVNIKGTKFKKLQLIHAAAPPV